MPSAAMTTYGGTQPLRRARMRPPPPVLIEPERPGDDGIDIKGLIEILRRRWRALPGQP